MKWFINMATKKKLFLGFGFIIVLMIIALIFCYKGIEQVQDAHGLLYNKEFQIAVGLKDIRANQNGIRANVLFLLTVKDPSMVQQRIANTKERAKLISDDIHKLKEIFKNEPKRLAQFEEFASIAQDFAKTRDSEVLPLLHAGNVEDAKKLITGIQTERDNKIKDLVDALVIDSEREASQSFKNAVTSGNRSIIVFIIIGIIAIVFSTVIVIFLSRIIAIPLNDITSIAGDISNGNLLVNIPFTDRTDEIGALVLAFAGMIRYLKEKARIAEKIAASDLTVEVTSLSDADTLGKSFSVMVKSLQRTITAVKEGITLLGSSASEILATTTQVASGTAETASAISETTTTIEEVRQAAQLSSEKAKNVSDKAQRVAQVSQGGQKSVEETAVGMGQIREQMESIAQTIMRLSEQSLSIGGIIASVTDLANQSNLLAVNAGIEASRAGEQGKGFAVVAQEIKVLAEQSKLSTEQVRGILSDIQKATSAAVMATEQGSKLVDIGVKQAAQAGEAIRVLAESSGEAAQSSTQIVASSQQQVVGMDQITIAMQNINQAGEQTATGMKQVELAAQNLHGLGEKLEGLVVQFKV
jgi:methyl-accepting chemotaxis protein